MHAGVFRRIAAVAQCAAGVSAVGSDLASFLATKLQLGDGRVHVIPNLLPAVFRQGYSQSPTRSESPTVSFLHVAELVPVKNQRLLLEAFSAACKGRPARLRLVGGGEGRQALEEFANHLGIAAQVEFLGRLSRLAVRDEMRSADCFVLTSNSETFGVVLIEAMSQGLPVISTACGGPSDIVNHQNGILVPPKDVGALANAMTAYLQGRVSFDRLLIAKQCLERFGEERVTDQYLALYRNAVHRSP